VRFEAQPINTAAVAKGSIEDRAANVDPEGMVIVAAPRQATPLRLLAGPRFTNEIFGTTGSRQSRKAGVN
jgi:hypothetical protein